MLSQGLDKARRWAGQVGAVPGMPRADSNGHMLARASPSGYSSAAMRRLNSPGLENGAAPSPGDEGLSEAERRQREAYVKQQALLREARKADEERLLTCISRAHLVSARRGGGPQKCCWVEGALPDSGWQHAASCVLQEASSRVHACSLCMQLVERIPGPGPSYGGRNLSCVPYIPY